VSGFGAIVVRDVRLAFRRGGEAALTVMFFLIVVALFPLGIGPEPAVLARIAPGVLWVAALLAATLSLDRLFRADHEDGSLDLMAVAPLPLELTVLAKALAHWLTSGLPLTVAAPILALMLQLDVASWPILIAAMALGTPTLSLVGAIGASLTLGARRGGVLASLIVLPLFVPVLIFGTSAMGAALSGLDPGPALLILGAFLLAALPLAPFATAAALRLALE
jgi:heme exporter protein B